MKKYKFWGIGLILVVIGVVVGGIWNYSGNGLVALSFEELKVKIDNKDSFVLCLTQTTCIHCADYKPKLEKIAKKYGIDIYYTDIDLYSDEDYENFKEVVQFRDSDGTPMTLFFIDGKEESVMTRMSGDVAEATVIKKLEKYGFIN